MKPSPSTAVSAACSTTGSGPPDATVTLEVLQGGKKVIGAAPQPLPTAGVTDMARLQYGSEVPLSTLAPGRNTLKVTVNDRVSKASASQQLNFIIE
ncbi:MAG TPA: hypothetical protein VF064_11730 [Pyrinomonadaceae bacterium]